MNNRASTHKRPPLTVFFAVMIVLFVLTLSAAESVGFVPDYIDGTRAEHVAADNTLEGDIVVTDLPQLGDEPSVQTLEEIIASASTSPAVTVLPSRIEIPAIDMNLAVQNPSTRDITALDALLQQGPARYVDSAELGEEGNIIIFAHSSHLPVVRNQMYKAFNRVPDLTEGDSITMHGKDGKKYLYSVVSVRKANANDATIDLSPANGTRLTLVTCDTLTNKSSRFILDATFVGVIE